MSMFAKFMVNAVDICPPLVPSKPHDIIDRGRESVHLPPFLNELIHDSLFLSHSPHSQCLSSFILANAFSVRILEEASTPSIYLIVSLRSKTSLLRRSDTFLISRSISLILRIRCPFNSIKKLFRSLRPAHP